MKKMLSAAALAAMLLISQATVLAEDQKITQEQPAQTLEERLVDVCLKMFSIVRELPQLDQVMKQVQQQKQTIEMTMMTRGMNKQKIEQLGHAILEKLMEGVELEQVVKTISAQPQYAPMSDLVTKFAGVLEQMLNIMVTASSAQEALKGLNEDAEKIKDEFIAKGKTEEEVMAMIQDVMKQIQDQFQEQMKAATDKQKNEATVTA